MSMQTREWQDAKRSQCEAPFSVNRPSVLARSKFLVAYLFTEII